MVTIYFVDVFAKMVFYSRFAAQAAAGGGGRGEHGGTKTENLYWNSTLWVADVNILRQPCKI